MSYRDAYKGGKFSHRVYTRTGSDGSRTHTSYRGFKDAFGTFYSTGSGRTTNYGPKRKD